MTPLERIVLAIDPGRSKCGVAVLACADSKSIPRILHRAVVNTATLSDTLQSLASQYSPNTIVVGDGTSSKPAVELVSSLGIGSVEVVDEKFTTLQARERYFRENPPRGLRKLIPVSLQTPPLPYDDYVAIILAERYLSS